MTAPPAIPTHEIHLDERAKRVFDIIPEHAMFKNGATIRVKCSLCKGAGCDDCDGTGKMEIEF